MFYAYVLNISSSFTPLHNVNKSRSYDLCIITTRPHTKKYHIIIILIYYHKTVHSVLQ